jgi:hypothetical protein
LKKFAITERKTLTLRPPVVLEKQKHIFSFIAGVIDGDGSVMKKRGGVRLVVYGTSWLLEWIREHFDAVTPSSKYKRAEVRRCKDGRNMSYYSVSGRRAASIWEIVRKLKLPLLNRKWSRFCENIS